MKTPMQEHIEWMQEKLRILVEYKDLSAGAEVDECIQHAESMLKKEKEVMDKIYKDSTVQFNISSVMDEYKPFEKYYNETFNTKEK